MEQQEHYREVDNFVVDKRKNPNGDREDKGQSESFGNENENKRTKLSLLDPPSSVRLTKSQTDGLEFCMNLEKEGDGGGVVAHDMGLGKSLIALELISMTLEEDPIGLPTLILCPCNLSQNWVSECEKFFPGAMSVLLYKGKNKKWISYPKKGEGGNKTRVETSGKSTPTKAFIAKHDIVVAHFDSIKRDWKKLEDAVKRDLTDFRNNLERGVAEKTSQLEKSSFQKKLDSLISDCKKCRDPSNITVPDFTTETTGGSGGDIWGRGEDVEPSPPGSRPAPPFLDPLWKKKLDIKWEVREQRAIKLDDLRQKHPWFSWPKKGSEGEDVLLKKMAKKNWIPNLEFRGGDGESSDTDDFDRTVTQYGVNPILYFSYKRIIADEAHTMRNHKTVGAKSCRSIRAPHRLALTGTPYVNSETDLWSLFKFLRVPNLPKFSEYKKTPRDEGYSRSHYVYYSSPAAFSSLPSPLSFGEISFDSMMEYKKWLKRTRIHVVTKKELSIEESASRSTTPTTTTFTNNIANGNEEESDPVFWESRDPSESMEIGPARGIPPLYISTLNIVPNTHFVDLYGSICEKRREKFCKIKDYEEKVNFMLATLSYLRQMCGSPTLIFQQGEGGTDVDTWDKYRSVEDYLKTRMKSDEKCIVFCHFKQNCYELRDYLRNRGYGSVVITGDHNAEEKVRSIEEFERTPEKKALICTHCISHGVTIVEATNHVLFLTPWWQDSEDSQCYGRCHRIGQTRAVHVCYLIVSGTIEEKIRTVADRKKKESIMSWNPETRKQKTQASAIANVLGYDL